MTEAQLQAEAIQIIRARLRSERVRNHVLIVNPFSEMQLHGNAKEKYSRLARLKGQGWEKSQPDIICLNDRRDFAIELKLPAKDPFRPMKNGTWFTETTAQEWNHVAGQAAKLSELQQMGKVAFFCSSHADVHEALDRALNGLQTAKTERHEFAFKYSTYQIEYFSRI